MSKRNGAYFYGMFEILVQGNKHAEFATFADDVPVAAKPNKDIQVYNSMGKAVTGVKQKLLILTFL